ncbi:four-carbon acid sugar kinase family protein [soil metagenome]
MAGLLILADDISGAAETAGAVVAATGARVELRLTHSSGPAPEVLVVDIDSRRLGARDAAAASSAALAEAGGRLVYKKVDSLLRGNIAAELSGLPADTGVVAALAVPRAGRSVIGGVMLVGGVPLHDSDAWRHEPADPPHNIEAALGRPAALIPLDVVRGDGLDAAVAAALHAGLAAVCDSETEGDLDLVAAALLRLDGPIVVVGTGGLARSLAPLLGLAPGVPAFRPGADRIVVVVGNRVPSAGEQVARLVQSGLRHLAAVPDAVPELGGGDIVVTLSAAHPWDAASIGRALTAVADAVLAAEGRTDLVLTGGDTARTVLDALGVTRLYAEREVEAGAVLSTTATGAAVVTRPGSFGGDDSLAAIVQHLRGSQQ